MAGEIVSRKRTFISVVGASLVLVTGVAAAQPAGWLGFQKVGRQPDKPDGHGGDPDE
jgi:hypothetical protein